MPPDPPAQPRVIVSRTRPPAVATTLAAELGADLVEMGSAGAKVAAVILGDADVYAHGGGQYEWDSGAPVAVALAAGLHATRLDGSPLVYNNPDPYLPDLLVCHPSLAGSRSQGDHAGSRTSASDSSSRTRATTMARSSLGGPAWNASTAPRMRSAISARRRRRPRSAGSRSGGPRRRARRPLRGPR